MAFNITAEQRDQLQQTVQDWRDGSATNNHYVTQEKVQQFQKQLESYGINFQDMNAIKNDPTISKIYNDMMVLGQQTPELLQKGINGGQATDAINNQWNDSIADLIATLGTAPTQEDSANNAISKAAWEGGNDDKLIKQDVDAKLIGTDITQEATSKYVDALKNPNASAEDIGKAQRELMIAYQIQYPNADHDALKAGFQDYMTSVLNQSQFDNNSHKADALVAVQYLGLSDQAMLGH